jgi:hypothetical protein
LASPRSACGFAMVDSKCWASASGSMSQKGGDAACACSASLHVMSRADQGETVRRRN